MKTLTGYGETLVTVAKNHILFIQDHYRSAIVAAMMGVFVWMLEFVKVYLFNDYQYLIYLLLMMAYNAASGISLANYRHKQEPDVYPKATAKVFADKTFSKLLYYSIVLNSMHAFTHFTIKGKAAGSVFSAVEYAILMTMIATEVYSIHENYKKMGQKVFWMIIVEAIQQYLPKKGGGSNGV